MVRLRRPTIGSRNPERDQVRHRRNYSWLTGKDRDAWREEWQKKTSVAAEFVRKMRDQQRAITFREEDQRRRLVAKIQRELNERTEIAARRMESELRLRVREERFMQQEKKRRELLQFVRATPRREPLSQQEQARRARTERARRFREIVRKYSASPFVADIPKRGRSVCVLNDARSSAPSTACEKLGRNTGNQPPHQSSYSSRNGIVSSRNLGGRISRGYSSNLNIDSSSSSALASPGSEARRTPRDNCFRKVKIVHN